MSHILLYYTLAMLSMLGIGSCVYTAVHSSKRDPIHTRSIWLEILFICVLLVSILGLGEQWYWPPGLNIAPWVLSILVFRSARKAIDIWIKHMEREAHICKEKEYRRRSVKHGERTI